jgi:hypothetical protein
MVLRSAPADAAARAQRASLRLVRGDFAGARADCAHLLAAAAPDRPSRSPAWHRSMPPRTVSTRAVRLLAAYPAPPAREAALRAYWLTVRGELFERANQLDRAMADYGAALTLEPQNDSIPRHAGGRTAGAR